MEKRGRWVLRLPGGSTGAILPVLRDSSHWITAKINWKGEDVLEIDSLDAATLRRITLISPRAIIKQRVHGGEKAMPKPADGWFEDVMKCPNPNCITARPKEPVLPRFRMARRIPLTLQCYYCGRYIDHETVVSQLTR